VADGSGDRPVSPNGGRLPEGGHRPVDGSRRPVDDAGRPAPALRHPLPLLESLVSDHLDPGYQAAADRRAAAAAAGAGQSGAARRRPRSRAVAYLVAGLVIVGLVLGVALTTTEDQAAGAEQARRSLLQDIDDAQNGQAALAVEQSQLAAAVRSAQASLGAGGPLATVSRLEVLGAQTQVSGPGLTVVIDGSGDKSGAGEILDRDVQLLVNGLWSAGAEAISIGGVRLRVTSAIRQAGSAILVDNRPVFFPISIQAVGDPSTLHVQFVGTVGFGRFQTFVSLYGIRFDITAQTAITLPPAGAPNLQYASPAPSSVTPTPTAPTMTGPTLTPPTTTVLTPTSR
jgi:uncharacterized protein YlxW (UPF0749 family)